MKFLVAIGRVSLPFIPDDPPPLPDAELAELPFGNPPREMRPGWIAEFESLEDLLESIDSNKAIFGVELSDYWDAKSVEEQGERLIGIGVMDDWEA